MHKKRVIGVFFVAVFVLMFSFSLVYAIPSVSLSGGSVSIAGLAADEYVYGYEIDINYTGTKPTVTYGDFLDSDGASVVEGESDDAINKVLTVYSSRLDSDRLGIDGTGNLFNLSGYSGSVSLGCKFFIYNDSTPTAEDCPAPAVTTPTATPTTSSGGGGSTAGRILVSGLAVDVKSINMELVLNSYKERIIKVINIGTESKSVTIGQSGLSDILVVKEEYFTLGPGESKEIRAVFIAPKETGIFTGKIFISGHEVLIALTVRSKELLFDAMIVVGDNSRLIKFGDKLDTEITQEG